MQKYVKKNNSPSWKRFLMLVQQDSSLEISAIENQFLYINRQTYCYQIQIIAIKYKWCLFTRKFHFDELVILESWQHRTFTKKNYIKKEAIMHVGCVQSKIFRFLEACLNRILESINIQTQANKFLQNRKPNKYHEEWYQTQKTKVLIIKTSCYFTLWYFMLW